MTSHLERPTEAQMAASFDDTAVDASPLPVSSPLPSYWLNTSHSPGPSRAVYGPQDGQALDPDVDVAIIGSGITGVSAAYHLANKLSRVASQNATSSSSPSTRSIAIFEARDFCSGATGRNGGHCTAVSVLSYTELAANPAHLARFIQTDAAREEQWGNDRGTKTDETIRRILTLEARTAAEILMLVRMNKAKVDADCSSTADEDVELVAGSNWHLCETAEEEKLFDDSIEAAKRAGLSDFALGVRKVPEAEWRPRLNDPTRITAAYEIPGSTLHPRRLVKLIYALAFSAGQKHGVDLKVFTQTPVHKITPAPSSGAYTVLHTDRGDVKARYVIHASNAYASHLLTQYSGPKGILPTRAQCLSISPDESPSKQDPLWQMGFSLNEGYEYLQQRPHPERSGTAPPCVLGGGRWAAKNGEWGVWDDGEINADVSKVLKPLLSTLFPHNFEPSTPPSLEWTGILGYTKSKDPFVGPVTSGLVAGSSQSSDPYEARAGDLIAGQYIAAGYSGHGMTRAFSCAEVVADMILDDMRGRQWQPPAWFPLCYLTALPSPSSTTQTSSAAAAPQNSKLLPSSSSNSPAKFALLCCGSNSSGQLSLGHEEDMHTWQPCLRVGPDGQRGPFPPEGTRVKALSSGAGHTVAIVEDDASGERTMWGCGDVDKGQLGPTLVSDSKRIVVFEPIRLRACASTEDIEWRPNFVATSWESSYVCCTPCDPQIFKTRKNQDDVLLCLGTANDFGQSGRGNSKVLSPHDPVAPLELPSSFGGDDRSPLRIIAIAAGVRHVLFLMTHTDIPRGEKTCALLGFGAGRHGQLGSPSGVVDQGDKVTWRPKVIQQWVVPATERDHELVTAIRAGRDHSAVLVPSSFVEVPGGSLPPPRTYPQSDGKKLYLFGSNRVGQLSLSVSAATDAGPSKTTPAGQYIESVGTTWNSTLALVRHPSQGALAIVGSGRNDKGQLGSGGWSTDTSVSIANGTIAQASLPEKISSSDGGMASLVCGSEHSLLVTSPQRRSDGHGGGQGGGNEVYGWGWNEHGNLALGHEDDVKVPTLVWSSGLHSGGGAGADSQGERVVTDAWAGCATSFIQVRNGVERG